MSVITADPAEVFSSVEERDATFKKIVWRIIPFLMTVWFLAWIDRVNIGFAKLTMMSDLGWSEAIYGAGAGIFFLGYFFFEVPSNILLQKYGARKTITRITVGWGVICVAMALVSGPVQFYILRFLMGAFEAGLQPGVILYLTYWLPAHRRGKAMAIFVSASASSLMIGSPLAAYLMETFAGVGGYKGWQWLFFIEGIPSILAGVFAWFWLSDTPRQAPWLSPAEKAHVASELSLEAKSLGDREHSFWASLKSGRMWVMIAIFFGIIAGNATLVYYGPTLVKEAGITNIRTLGWVMAGIYGCGFLGMLFNGWSSDHFKEFRWHTAIAAAIGALGLLMASYFITNNSLAGVIFALAVSAAGTMAAIPIYWQIPARYLSATALVVGLAVINSIANLSGYFSPQLLGSLKTNTGTFTTGLILIACVELVASVLIIMFVSNVKSRSVVTAAA